MEKLSLKLRVGASEEAVMSDINDYIHWWFCSNHLVCQKRVGTKFAYNIICLCLNLGMQRPYKITKYHSRDKYNQQRWRYLCEKLQDERDKQKKGNTNLCMRLTWKLLLLNSVVCTFYVAKYHSLQIVDLFLKITFWQIIGLHFKFLFLKENFD